MQTVEEIAAQIVAREGGYVDDPDDPGGATNHGVTIGTLRRLGIDLNGDDRVGTDDLRRLTGAPLLDEIPHLRLGSTGDRDRRRPERGTRTAQRLPDPIEERAAI